MGVSHASDASLGHRAINKEVLNTSSSSFDSEFSAEVNGHIRFTDYVATIDARTHARTQPAEDICPTGKVGEGLAGTNEDTVCSSELDTSATGRGQYGQRAYLCINKAHAGSTEPAVSCVELAGRGPIQ